MLVYFLASIDGLAFLRATEAYNFLLLCAFLSRPDAFTSRSRPRVAPLTPRPRGTLLAEACRNRLIDRFASHLRLPKEGGNIDREFLVELDTLEFLNKGPQL
jgi:hypothetical protein